VGLPIVSDIADFVRWIIDVFMNRTPRPVQILLFLLMLLLIGNLFSWALHLSGVHCRSDGEPVKVSSMDIVTNVKIFWWIQEDGFTKPNISVSEVHPWGDRISQSGEAIDQCIVEMKYNPSKDRYEFCDSVNDTNCKIYYDRGECFNCTELDVGWAYSPVAIFKYFNIGKVCDSDAYPKFGLNWFQRNYLCNPLCEIPEHYAFSRDELHFYCTDLDYCGVNATKQPNPKLDSELLLSDAELIYTNDDENTIEKFIGITCSDNYNPRLAVFTIDIFNYQYWVLMIVLYVMVIFLTKIKRH